MSRKNLIEATAHYSKEVLYDPVGIFGWMIKWKLEPPEDPEAWASIQAVEGRKVAWVNLSNDFPDQPSDIIHATLIHELLHLVHRDQTDVIEHGAPKSGMAPAAYDVMYELFRLQTELMVDHLTDRFSELIPINEDLMKSIQKQGAKGKK